MASISRFYEVMVGSWQYNTKADQAEEIHNLGDEPAVKDNRVVLRHWFLLFSARRDQERDKRRGSGS
jgi:hypothetical protein